jgi:hypothetical protein
MTRATRFSSTNPITGSSAVSLLKNLALGGILSIALGALFAQVPGHATTVAQDPLPYSKGYLVTGNYVVAGVDLPKANASGAITVTGVPDNADIISADLYWETTSSVDISPALTAVTFQGNALYGTDANGLPKPLVPIKTTTTTQLPGNGANCWGSANGAGRSLVMFRADVVRFLPKQLDANNAWTGKRLANGSYTITLPQVGTGNVLTQSAGATLFIVYRDPEPDRVKNPLRKIVVYDGLYANPQGETMSQTIKGFYKSATTESAKITEIVGSGATNPFESLAFTGASGSLAFADPFPAQVYSSADRAWANPTYDVSSGMPGTGLGGPYGETVSATVAHSVSTPYECLAWSAVIFSTAVADVDHDGLPDGLEDDAVGLKDPDGTVLPKLKAMGAGSDQQDIFVEINAQWAAPGTTYGSADAPINPANNEITRTDLVGHHHLPAPQDLKLVGDAYSGHGIRPHFDVGDITAYHSLGVVQHSTWVDDYTSTVADAYLVPSNFARGGELIQERACDPSGPACLFPAYPGAIPWKLGMQFERDAPVGDNGEELTAAGLTAWLTDPTQRQRFDPERRGLFHYVLFAHTRGKPKSPFPCLDANSQPTGFGADTTTCAVAVNKDHHVPSSASGISDLGANAMVTLGMWDEFVGTPFVRASTLFHELGHNLGLFHGGLPPIWGDKTKNPPTATYVEPNCKPNYFSSMSYLFQAHGLMDDSGELHLDYSGAALNNINENLLTDGPLGAPSYVPVWFAPFSSPLAMLQAAPQATRFCNGVKFDPASPPSPAMARVEAALSTDSIVWDGGSNLLGPQNVNFDGTASGVSVITSPLFGFNDWANIRLDQIGDLPDTKTNADGLGELADIFGGNLAEMFGSDVKDIFSLSGAEDLLGGAEDLLGGAEDLLGGAEDLLGGAEDLLGGDVAGLRGGAEDLLGGAEDLLGGGELTVEHARGEGASRPHVFRACVIGMPGCAPGTPFTPTYHRVQTSWKAPTFGHVVGYHVYRVTGGAVTATNLAAKVEVQGSPTSATTLTLIDPEELPDSVQFTYFATAEFDDETPHRFSGASNLATITAVNAPPVAFANSYSCAQAANVPAPGVLGNDTDVDSPITVARPQPLTAVLVTPPALGVLTLNANGGFTYVRANGTGATFTYKANNGKWSRDPSVSMNSQDSNTVTVSITTNGCNK